MIVLHTEAVRRTTGGRCILEFKRTGVWKVMTVVGGYKENKVYLDGEGFDYTANVDLRDRGSQERALRSPREPKTGKPEDESDCSARRPLTATQSSSGRPTC